MGCCCCGCKGFCNELAAAVTCTSGEYTPHFEAEYHHILRFKGQRAVYHKPEGSKYSIGQLKYRQDLGAGKVLWHDDFRDDVVQNAKNNNLYVTPWTASRMHPFNRKERLVVVLATVIVSFALAFLKAALMKSIEEDAEDNDEKYTASDETTFSLIYSTVNSTLLFIYYTVHIMLATCSCVQGEACVSYRGFGETIAHWAMFVWFVIWTVFFLTFGLISAGSHGINWGACILNTLISLLMCAAVYDPAFMIWIYYSGRRKERKEEKHQCERVAKGKETKYKYNVPYSYYVQWKEAGFPKFDADANDLSDDEKTNADDVIDRDNANAECERPESEKPTTAGGQVPVEAAVAVGIELATTTV